MRAELRICISGSAAVSKCEGACISRRIGAFEVIGVCLEGECKGLLQELVDGLDENTIRRLQSMCRGAGGCVESIIEDGMFCCPTNLRDMPGISSIASALKERGVEIRLERGIVILCTPVGPVKEIVEKLRNAFLLLEGVYDMQRRIAEGVAKSIMLAGEERGGEKRGGRGGRKEGGSRES